MALSRIQDRFIVTNPPEVNLLFSGKICNHRLQEERLLVVRTNSFDQRGTEIDKIEGRQIQNAETP